MDLHIKTSGVILIGTDGRLLHINDEARLALGEKPVSAIANPGFGDNPTFFQGKSGKYRIRTVPIAKKGKGKIILLEPTPPRHRIHSRLTHFGLSRREEEITIFAIQGLSNKEIAERLFICEQTVKDHLHHVFGKMNIRRRSELAAKIMGLAPQAASSI